jgi:hypothetical protein
LVPTTRYDEKARNEGFGGENAPILLPTFGIPAIVAGVIRWIVL